MASLTTDKAAAQQELSSARDRLVLLESELKLKASRLEAAQAQLATQAQEHAAELALLQKQLEQLKVGGGLWSSGGGDGGSSSWAGAVGS